MQRNSHSNISCSINRQNLATWSLNNFVESLGDKDEFGTDFSEHVTQIEDVSEFIRSVWQVQITNSVKFMSDLRQGTWRYHIS